MIILLKLQLLLSFIAMHFSCYLAQKQARTPLLIQSGRTWGEVISDFTAVNEPGSLGMSTNQSESKIQQCGSLRTFNSYANMCSASIKTYHGGLFYNAVIGLLQVAM